MAKIQVQVEQIASRIRQDFESTIDVSDLGGHASPQFEDSVISRCLAAYAVQWNSGCSPTEAGNSVTDSTGDNGIDAIYYDSKSQRLTVVQSKLIKDGISEPSCQDLRTFRDGIYDLLEGRLSKFNGKVLAKHSEVRKIKEFGTKIDIVVVHTGKDGLADPATQVVRELLTDLNGDEDDGVFSFSNFHKKRIVASLASSLSQQSIDLEFLLKDFGIVKEPYTAFYGKISGDKLVEWWSSYHDQLFRDNIRKSLGNTAVNALLSDSIRDTPELFWYFNNGITVIADEVTKSPENGAKRDFGIFKATNASIVNGAQTYSTIGKSGSRGTIVEKIEVPFRVIAVGADSSTVKQDITRYNNTQNTILPKDFLSQDPLQVNLQTQLALSNYVYVIKRDEGYQSAPSVFDIDEVIEAMIILSDRPTFAAAFKKEIGRFYNVESALYKSLFNESTNPYFMINAIRVLRSMKTVIKSAANELEETRGDLVKVRTIADSGFLVVGQAIFKMLSPAEKGNFAASTSTYIYSQRQVYVGLEKVAEAINRDFAENYLVTLFQNSDKCSKVLASI